MTHRAPLVLISLGAFKGTLDGTFHELFGAPSVPSIPSAPSTVQFSYTVLSGPGALSDLDGTLSSPAPSVALASSAARDAHALNGSVSSLAPSVVMRLCFVRVSTSLDGAKRLRRHARCSTYDAFHDIFGAFSVSSAPSTVQSSAAPAPSAVMVPLSPGP